MKKLQLGGLIARGLAAGAAIMSFGTVAKATPYATCLTNNSGTISFRLNESADMVKIISNGGATTNVLNARPFGLTVTNLGITGSFKVEVSKNSNPGYLDGAAQQISVDTTNTLRFINPRGVAVNNNPTSPYFGRIYMANAIAGSTGGTPNRAVGDGIYVMNADYSDALGQGNTALTAGITNFNQLDNGNSPWRLDVGADNNLYISDFSTNSGGIFVTDPNVSNGSGTNVIAGLGSPGRPTATFNHGRIGSSVIATGSLATGDLSLVALEGDLATKNRLHRWNIGAGPLPADVAATNVNNAVQADLNNQALLEIAGVTVDMDQGPDGKYYLLQNRSSGGEAGIFVVDPNVDMNDDFGSGIPDGMADVVYDSRNDSIFNYGATADLLLTARAVKISPDGKLMAVVRDDSQTWIIPLVNGIPNLAARRLVPTGSVSTGRDVTFDAAGNLYVSTSGHAVLRVFSPGYGSVATTGSDGTFNVVQVLPPSTVEITASNPFAAEPSTPGTFTFTRSGDTSSDVVVNYTITGTAKNGTDYQTNSGSATIPAGSSSVDVAITPIDDNFNEPDETVIFTLKASTNYFIGTSRTATITITDDGDLPGVNVAVGSKGAGYELLPDHIAQFNVYILNAYPSDVTVNFTMSGTAVAGVNYTNIPLSVTIPAGSTNALVTIAPIDDQTINTNRTVTLTVATGTGYVLGANNNATLVIRNDDLASAPALFAEDFDVDHTANWTVKVKDSDTFSDLFFDYSTVGIPSAPHSVGGTTRGMKLKAHLGAASNLTGISASPSGKTFSGDYRLRFDLWINYNGPLPAGGTGSTEYTFFGLGASESNTNWQGGNPGPALYFAVDGDGGQAASGGDFRVYTNTISIAQPSPIVNFGAGTGAGARDNFDPFYSEFGGVAAPAAQLAVLPNQTGLTPAGSLGLCWHDVIITKIGSVVTMDLDGLRFATVTVTNLPLTGDIFFAYSDVNNTTTSDNQTAIFGLFDNVKVESLTVTPVQVTAIALINGGAQVQIDFTAAASDAASAFTLQSSSTLNGAFADTGATITSTGTGTFRAVITASGSTGFFRIKR